MPYESNTWKMYVIGFLAHLQFFVAVSVPFFMDWGGLNFTKILFLQSWFMFWSFVMEIPTGAIADYFGRKTSILLACFINGIAALIYGSIPNFYVFMLGEFVWGMSIALISGADNALIYDSLKKTNKTKTAKKIFARYTYMTSLGIVVAGPIGSFIAGFLGLRSSMLLTSIPLFLAGLISLTLKEPKVRNRTKERTKYLDLIKEGIKFIKNNKILRILSLDFSLMFLLFYFILWLWQPMLQKSRLNIVYWGFVSSAFNVFSIIIAENIERIEKLFGKKIFLFSSFLVAGVLYFFGGLTNYLPFILIIRISE